MGKYLKQLTNSEIEYILKENNFALCTTLKSYDGEPLPAIERSDDMIFVRCQRILSEDEKEIDSFLAYTLMKKHPLFITASMLARCGEFSSNIDLITFSDFHANLLSVDTHDEERSYKLADSYIDYMLERFKNQGYQKAFDRQNERLINSAHESSLII